MKAIVYLKNGKKHSAWDSVAEAKKQIEVLKNHGYKGCYYDTVEHCYENGHYFV